MNKESAMNFEDFASITGRRYDYAMGIDTHDFELLRSVFAEEIVMDFEDYSRKPSEKLRADAWVESCKPLFLGLTSTQHVMTNPVVKVFGDTATCRMYMQAEHFLETEKGLESYVLGGYYLDKLVRSGGRWFITGVTLKLFWTRGNRDIMKAATLIGQSKL
ncbi:MAG: hypothetical protein CMQ40_08000 [Gammaproteobacteria bacterium]|nr:hypothetical protein [Gammaproteobacteria bacterium]